MFRSKKHNALTQKVIRLQSILVCQKEKIKCSNVIKQCKNYLLINKRDGISLKRYNDFKAFIEYSNDMYNIYEYIEEHILNKERKIYMLTCLTIKNFKKSNRIVYYRKKTKYFHCFYYTYLTILLYQKLLD